MNGIICINKPEGFTSFDVIAKLRGILHMRRLGHAGTLDPMATGVLPVFVGYATKACHLLPDEEKIYFAEFQLGQVSDTQDSTGTILETHDFSGVTKEKISESIPVGEMMQIPPMYSAVSVNGKRLYELARKGIEVERPERKIYIRRAECTAFDERTGKGILSIHCGKGTYVRTIIHDMGEKLTCGAVMTGLKRIYASGFHLEECYTLEQVQKFSEENRLPEIIIPVEKIFSTLPKINLNAEQTEHYRHGVKLGLHQLRTQLTTAERYAVYGTPDGFLGTALTDKENDCLRIERNLCEPRKGTP